MYSADSPLDAHEIARIRALLEGPGRKPRLGAMLAAIAFVAMSMLGLALTLVVAHPPM